MLYQLPEYSFILNSTNPFPLLVANDFDNINPNFIKRNLTDYYRSFYANAGSP